MVNKKTIKNFFDYEAEASKHKWEVTMSLQVKERIRQRKSIGELYIDRMYKGTSIEGDTLLKLRLKQTNLSDFKEGDALLLHKESLSTGIACSLYEFSSDGNEECIIIAINPYNYPGSLDCYYDEPLILDKNCIDLRPYIYNKFTDCLTTNEDPWMKHFVNSKPTPQINEDELECYKQVLNELSKMFKLEFNEKQRQAITNSLATQDYYLIQGPPGSGKSFVLGFIMFVECFIKNHNVIVTGPNHKAINNAIEQLLKMYPTSKIMKVGQSYNKSTLTITVDGNEYCVENRISINKDEADNLETNWVVGLTPHALFTKRAEGLKADTLIIDEAGQMPIPLAMMAIINANKVILAGDHKQLPPIITSDKNVDEMKSSIFQHLVHTDNCTMLNTSYRMCGPICHFVSDIFYDGKLKPFRENSDNVITAVGDPLFDFSSPVILKNIEDSGEQFSDKEADFVVETIEGFINLGIDANDVAILAPFRAQAANIRRKIRASEHIPVEQKDKVAVDTIDKMQGQGKTVIIVSMTGGNDEYIKEMGEFLYSPNKLNVAFSRAESKLIVVGNFEKIKEVVSKEEYPQVHKMINSPYIVSL